MTGRFRHYRQTKRKNLRQNLLRLLLQPELRNRKPKKTRLGKSEAGGLRFEFELATKS